MAALADNVFPEQLNSLLALTFSGEDHRTIFTIQVNKDRHVALSAFAGSLVEAESPKPAEVNALHGLSHIVVDESPETFVGCAYKRGDGGHGHLSGQGHDNLLEE